jgi:hypothetical protein
MLHVFCANTDTAFLIPQFANWGSYAWLLRMEQPIKSVVFSKFWMFYIDWRGESRTCMEGKNQMVFKDKQFAVLQHCAEKLSETMVCVKDFYT